MTENIVCIIQARMGSTRLPGKVLMDLSGKPVLTRVIERLRQSRMLTTIVVATTEGQKDDNLVSFMKEAHPECGVFRGSEQDVLDRYYKAAHETGATIVVRVTSDCPLIDPEVVDEVVTKLIEAKVDYAANILGSRTYPRGFDVEVIRFSALERLWHEACDPEDREHVTLYLRKHPELFSTANVTVDHDYSQLRLTLDEPRDYDLLRKVYGHLGDAPEHARLADINAIFVQYPELVSINAEVTQKHGNF